MSVTEADLRAEIARVCAKAARWEVRAAAAKRPKAFIGPAKMMRKSIAMAEKASGSGSPRLVDLALKDLRSYNSDD